MSKKLCYKWCFVPQCNNTTRKTPSKLFFPVPSDKDLRKKWYKSANRHDEPGSSNNYCCEDHFSLREDMENYVRYSLTGAPIKIQKGVLPHFFDCQEQRTNKKRPAPRSAYLKLNRKREIDSILSSVKSNKDVNDSTKTEMPLMKKCKEDKDDSKRHTSNSVIIINSLEGGIANYRYFKEMNYMDWIPPLVPLTRRLDCQRFSEQTHISDSDDEEVEIKMEIIDEPVGMVSNCEVKLLDNSEVKLDNNKEETRWGNFIPYISNFVKVDIEHNEDEENLQEENQPPFAFVEVKTESI